MTKDFDRRGVPDHDDDKVIGKDVPFKKSYQPKDDDLDSSNPPQGSGGPPKPASGDEENDD